LEAVKLSENRFLGFTKDITLNKQAELELINSRKRAQKADSLKTMFLQNISHEVRSPMSVIIGFSQLISQTNLDEKQSLFVNQIIDSSESLLKSGIEFFLNYDIPTDINLNSDEARMKQVLTNLVSNALKYTNNGKIEFSCYLNDNDIIFKVKDTGIGIKEEDKENIFDRFYIGESNKVGTGLGLAIVKSLSELLGGSIWFDSDEGVGSCFYFSMPVIDICNFNFKQETVIEKDKSIEIPDLSFSKALVVEDEEANFALLEIALEDSGIYISRSETGEHALEVLKSKNDFDIVLLDIKLPGIDGYEVATEIRKFNKAIPIIVQSAFAHDGAREKAKKSGCNDFIEKPINLEILASTMSKYCIDLK